MLIMATPRDPTELPTDPPVDPAPGPTPAPPSRGRGCICGFCECKITADGDVLKMSDVAKGYVTQEEELTDARKSLKEARESITVLEEKLKSLQTPERKASVRDGLRLGG